MRKFFKSLVFMGLALFAMGVARAESRFTDSQLIQILKDDGYSSVEQLKPGVIKIRVNGQTIGLFNQEDGDLQLFYSLKDVRISFEDINTWNRTKRLSRGYLDKDSDPCLEADLLSNGGMTRKNVTEFVRIFQGSIDGFRKFLSEHTQN